MTEENRTGGTAADAQAEVPKAPQQHGGILPFLLDFGPLLVFFVTFRWNAPATGEVTAFGATAAAIQGTIAFMIAIAIAVIISKWRLKRVSPMLWLSAVLVIGFGALTVYFHDARFIQLKPTIIYGFFALMLLGGWWRGKALLKILLQSAYDGLDDAGWLKLSRNWGLFFVGLALFNEATRLLLDFDLWLTLKVWGVTALSFIFVLAQIPMLMRHGLALDDKEDAPKGQ